MALLIDGYNLLYLSGVTGQGAGGALERSRRALLELLAGALDDRERAETTVVFDAQDAPPGLPSVLRHGELTVRYTARHEEADDLIEQLIRCDSAPRRLVVVSSDHRVQRAARRRRATAVDSDQWLAALRRRRRASSASDGEAKPSPPLSAEEVRAWLSEFSGEQASPPPSAAAAAEGAIEEDSANPFPPGYGEDLLRRREP